MFFESLEGRRFFSAAPAATFAPAAAMAGEGDAAAVSVAARRAPRRADIAGYYLGELRHRGQPFRTVELYIGPVRGGRFPVSVLFPDGSAEPGNDDLGLRARGAIRGQTVRIRASEPGIRPRAGQRISLAGPVRVDAQGTYLRAHYSLFDGRVRGRHRYAGIAFLRQVSSVTEEWGGGAGGFGA